MIIKHLLTLENVSLTFFSANLFPSEKKNAHIALKNDVRANIYGK